MFRNLVAKTPRFRNFGGRDRCQNVELSHFALLGKARVPPRILMTFGAGRASWLLPVIEAHCCIIIDAGPGGHASWLSRQHDKSTPVGFEPTRGDPIGLAGRRLSRSAKVSMLHGKIERPAVSVKHAAHKSERSKTTEEKRRESKAKVQASNLLGGCSLEYCNASAQRHLGRILRMCKHTASHFDLETGQDQLRSPQLFRSSRHLGRVRSSRHAQTQRSIIIPPGKGDFQRMKTSPCQAVYNVRHLDHVHA